MINRQSDTPLYIQLADILREKIKSGEIAAGDMLPSENEMKSEYGIARLTIREALSVLVNEGLLEKRHGKGTFCKAPSGLDIDVLLDMTDYYFIPYYMQSVSRVLDRAGASFRAGDTKNSWQTIVGMIEKISENGSDGVIVQASPEIDYDKEAVISAFKKLDDAGIPYIFLDTEFETGGSRVVMDEMQSGVIAARCFRAYGHKKTATVYVENNCLSKMRNEGFCSIYPDAEKIPFNDKLSHSLKRARDNGITAIICFSDYVAKVCLDVFSELEISVPEEISVITIDDTIISKIYQLTAVAHPKEALGEFAAQMLAEGKLPCDEVFEPKLVERKSVKRIN